MKPVRHTKHMLRILSSLALIVLLMALGSAPARAAPDDTITVNSAADVIDDDGQCTLREAITAANTDTASGDSGGECPAGSGADTITLPAGTYTLAIAGHSENNNATGDLDLTSHITINGAGAESTVIDANQIDRVLQVASGRTVELNGLTLANGRSPNAGLQDCYGGGVYNHGALTIRDSAVRGNATGAYDSGCNGGGVYSQGTLTIENSAVSDNATGNGAWGNYSGGDGGGVYIESGTVTIVNSVISGNRTGNGAGSGWDGDGGGIFILHGTVTIENTTISGNKAKGDGGGVLTYFSDSTLTLVHCTVTDNTADDDADNIGSGGGIRRGGGTVNYKNTIVAGNDDKSGSVYDDCYIMPTSQGYNLVGSGTGCPHDGTGDQTTGDPKLGPLQDNSPSSGSGLATHTHALQYDSPAVERIPRLTNGCGDTYTSDQRGETRPRGGLCDVGAYESSYIIWDGDGGDNNTTTAENWSGDTTPATTDVPVFDDTNLKNATVDSDLTVAGWIIDSGYSGAINSASYNLTLNGPYEQSGGSFTAPSGLMTISGGFHHSSGSFDPNGGRVVLDNTTDQTLATTFHDLYLNDGLLGYWKLDEGSGTTTADSSGYGYDGVLHNSPLWSTDTPGVMDFKDSYALQFDRVGNAEYVTMSDTPEIDEAQELTLSTWVRLASTPTGADNTYMRFVTLRNEKAVLRYSDHSGTGQLQFYMTIGGSVRSIAVDYIWGIGAWYHVAGTYDGSTMRLYLDGVELDTHGISNEVATGDGVRLSHSASSEALDGLLDDVRVYNRALSATDIGHLAAGKHPNISQATTILVATLDVGGDLTLNSGTLDVSAPMSSYWKLDEGSGATAADSSGNGNEGTLIGGPTWTTDTPSTHFSNTKALDFDGVADDVSGEVSIAFWEKAASDRGIRQILVAANTAAGGNVLFLFISGDDEYQLYDGGSAHWEGDTQTDVADGSWHHLAYTTDGTTGRLYVDGEEKATHTPDYSFSNDDLWSIGQEWDGGSPSEYLDGIVDDVRVYNGVLSAAEVQALADGYDVRSHDINIAGDFIRNGGVFEAGGGMIIFDGSGTQTLDTDVITLYNLTVNSGVTLATEADLTVNGSVTHESDSTTQETKDVAGAGSLSFSLADVTINVTEKDGLSSLQVVRKEAAHVDATSGIETGQYWSITPSGGGYSVDLTLPQADLVDPSVCRLADNYWDCARTSSDVETVTRTGITALSDWAVGDGIQPAVAPSVAISVSNDDIELGWTPDEANGEGYMVSYSTNPYFQIGDPGVSSEQAAAPDSFIHSGAAADVDNNFCYLIQGVNGAGVKSDPSNKTCEFGFSLVPGNE